jgi:hypothetical protein
MRGQHPLALSVGELAVVGFDAEDVGDVAVDAAVAVGPLAIDRRRAELAVLPSPVNAGKKLQRVLSDRLVVWP